MIEQALWRFLESDKRKQAVIIGTIVTGLVAVWPAADEYMAAGKRVRDAKSALEESQQEVNKLPKYAQVFEMRQAELAKLESQVVGEEEAQALLTRLRGLVRTTKCKMRTTKLGTALVRDWQEEDSPVNNSVRRPGGDTPFRLATRQISISITGTNPNISTFLEKMHEIDKLVHTKTISLKRAGERSREQSLDLEILVFDLMLKAET